MADIQRPHHAIDQGSDADTTHAASASASRARPRGDDKKASHSRGEGYINPTRSDRVIQPLSASQTTSKPFTNSTSRDVEMAATTVTKTTSDQDAEMMTTLSQLEKQVGNGTYIIRRPLTTRTASTKIHFRQLFLSGTTLCAVPRNSIRAQIRYINDAV